MSCGIFIELVRMHAEKVLGYFLSKALEVLMDAFCGLNSVDGSHLEFLAKKVSKLNKSKVLALEVVLQEFLKE